MTVHTIESLLGRATPIPDTGCWLWLGSLDTRGYASTRFSGRTRRVMKVVAEQVTGDDLRGKHVLHSCDQRSCINPDHLRVGTNMDNVEDKIRKGRQAKKPSASMVIRLRMLYDGGVWTQRMLAAEFGIGQAQVSRIVNRIRRERVP